MIIDSLQNSKNWDEKLKEFEKTYQPENNYSYDSQVKEVVIKKKKNKHRKAKNKSSLSQKPTRLVMNENNEYSDRMPKFHGSFLDILQRDISSKVNISHEKYNIKGVFGLPKVLKQKSSKQEKPKKIVVTN